MKKRNVSKKLDINKTTICNMDKEELSAPRGGGRFTDSLDCRMSEGDVKTWCKDDKTVS